MVLLTKEQAGRIIKNSSATEGGQEVLADLFCFSYFFPTVLFSTFMSHVTVLYTNWNAMTKPGVSNFTKYIRLIIH